MNSLDDLKKFFDDNPRFALAFSGGTDSAFLMHAARKYGADIRCYSVFSEFQPQFELDDVLRLDPDAVIIRAEVLSDPKIRENSPLRCYHCKMRVFSLIKSRAEADGFDMVCDGTNASDSFDDRPGMKALAELGIRSPLRECGLTKAEIRAYSADEGLFTADKPSYSCLATRIPSGTAITAAALERIEDGETSLFGLGFSDFRLRLRGDHFSLELLPEQTEAARAIFDTLTARLGPLELTLSLRRRE
ncbi:MAG: ATP-dependent sacrificial sulfur transferase LarE [Oscillospiraceae bacterium]|nr:ATP-dependent sacrificial sulfur transferase LarE [Oscillospiraceae bacterium]